MFVDHIKLENFRNYTSSDIDLSNDVNVFYGNNGQGKTNLLEAIFYGAVGKSFRGTKDLDVIKSGQKYFFLNIKINDDITEDITIKYNKTKEKYIKVNGLYLRKLGQLMGNILAVIFSPEDLKLISEGPSMRRKFMDIAISQMKPLFYFDLLNYAKILNQKNNLLRAIKYGKMKSDFDLLSLWNEQLAEAGAKIIVERNYLIQAISSIAEEKHQIIAQKSAEKQEKLEMIYHSDISPEILNTQDIKSIKTELLYSLNSKRDREVEREITLTGPHRDDIDFILNGNDLKRFGSQGQKRTVVLALKISELKLIQNMTGRKPIFLLDDVFSELDDARQKAFLNELGSVQTMISCVDPAPVTQIYKNAAFYEIKDGHVIL